MTSGFDLINSGDGGTTYNVPNINNLAGFAAGQTNFGRCIDIADGTNPDPTTRYFEKEFTSSSQNWIGSGDFCIGAWAKLSDRGGDQMILEFGTADPEEAGIYNYVKIYNWSANTTRFQVYIDSSANTNHSSGSAVNDDWHHFMVERSGSTVTFYIDNSSVGTWSGAGTFDPFDQIRIGRWWEGNIDEVFLMTRTATSAEKTSMQSGVISGISSMYTDSDLKLYYNCDNTIVYPNIPNGAIFEESDTGKHYMFDGTSAWNEM